MAKNDKLALAAHYLIARVRPSDLGATKLQKILWFADCAHYRRHGRSITGEILYKRKPNGPCVARLSEALAGLESEGAIVERRVMTVIGHERREFTALVEPDVSDFSGEEIDLLLQVATEIAGMTAQEVSDRSHDALWAETPSNGTISVAAGAVNVRSLEASELDWARSAFQ